MIRNVLKNKKVLVIAVVSLIIGIFLIRYYISAKKPGAQSAIVKTGDIIQKLTLSGKIEAEEKVTLQFQAPGLLAYVGVKEGDLVNKYQTIASLDVRQTQKTLQKYLNTYLKTRLDFDQTKSDSPDQALYTDKIKRLVQKSQADLDNSVLDVEIQNLALELSTLITPIPGIVTKVQAPFPGVNITATGAQFEIVNPDSLFFSISADQTEVVKIKQEEKTEIILDSYPEEPLEGKITSIGFSPKQNETATVYEIKIPLTQKDGKTKYKLGMTGDANFVLAKRENVLYLPVQFIKSDDKGSYVLLGKNRKQTYIEIGIEQENRVEIKSGLSEGDLVYD